MPKNMKYRLDDLVSFDDCQERVKVIFQLEQTIGNHA